MSSDPVTAVFVFIVVGTVGLAIVLITRQTFNERLGGGDQGRLFRRALRKGRLPADACRTEWRDFVKRQLAVHTTRSLWIRGVVVFAAAIALVAAGLPSFLSGDPVESWSPAALIAAAMPLTLVQLVLLRPRFLRLRELLDQEESPAAGGG